MSILVDGVAVPVVWRPSDLKGPDSDGHVGRGRQVIRGLVYHRIVGTLETTVNSTFAPTTDDLLTPGERRVSSHFSLGFWGPALRVVQHVALENTAYCNGQTARDREACRWQTWIDAGRPDANEMTVSFEHEDNAAAGNYVVREEVVRLSIALTRLLLSGDGPRIRAAGIRCSDAAAAQLGRIVPSTQTLVPHRTVAPVTKPYCWMPYGGDKGFPQARYVAELTAQEALVPPIDITSETPALIDVPKGTPFLDLDGQTVLVESWAADFKDRFSPYECGGFRAMYGTVAGVRRVGLTRFAAKRAVPAPEADCSAAVKAATDPLQHTIADREDRLARIKTLSSV